MYSSGTVFFYGSQALVWPEAETLRDPHSHAWPDGLIMRSPNQNWYIYRWGSFTSINLCDLPKEVRLLTLII